MNYKIPRVIIAGTGSGCGKTTVCCAILKALSDRGLQVGAFKCGPDYIDPMFHAHILGKPSTNLDSFFFGENTLKWLLAKNGNGKDICVTEGVMGYYDGLGISSDRASSYEIARITGTPVILVLNAKGSALSLLAVLQGFLTFRENHRICAVILNNCTASTYSVLSKTITEYFEGKVLPLGYLPVLPDCSLESRHLGLVTAAEMADLDEKLGKLSEQAQKTIDLEKLLQIASLADDLICDPVAVPSFQNPVRIAVAQDKAFCFCYHDNLDLLREMGAELIPFSPLADETLLSDIHGLYLTGGYPELYACTLSDNVTMRESVRQALKDGLPCIAECGGFMYLTKSIEQYPMAGLFDANCHNTKKLTRFGYIHLKAKHNNMLCREGVEIAAHEFHYWDCGANGSDFTATKPSGKQWDCVYANSHLYAGFPHFHFYANPDFAVNFYKTCLKYKGEIHA